MESTKIQIPAQTNEKPFQENEVSRLLTEIHKYNHCNYDLDYQGRMNKFLKLREAVHEIARKIRNLPSEEIEKTDIRLLNTQLPLFPWAYYGFSIKEVAEDIVGIYKYVFANLINEINSSRKHFIVSNDARLKILFVSERLNRFSSVFRDRSQIIKELSEDREFIVDVMTNCPIDDVVRPTYSKINSLIPFTPDLRKNIEVVANGRYDIIVYPDLHMDGRTSFMSLCRLAPISINTFGHSDTSGSADYFITSELYEPTGFEQNYTEKVIRLKSLNTKYSRLLTEEHRKSFKTIDHFYLPKNANLYLCCASPFKFGFEMIEIFKGILERDENALIILTELDGKYDVPLWNTIEKNISESQGLHRIRLIKRLTPLQLMNLNYLGKVCLEPVPFGSLNTTLECFETGLPVVSLPGSKINNRFTLGFYKKMGISEYVVSCVADYIDLAVRLANEPEESHLARRKELVEKSQVLFDEVESVNEWKQLLRDLHKGKYL